MSLQSKFAELARTGGRGALVTVLRGPGAGLRLFVDADGSTEGSLGGALDEIALRHADELMWDERSEAREEGDALLFVDVTFPAPRLIIFGAVDFAAALVRLVRDIGWRAPVVGPPPRVAPPRRLPPAAGGTLPPPGGGLPAPRGVRPAAGGP